MKYGKSGGAGLGSPAALKLCYGAPVACPPVAEILLLSFE